MSKRKFRPGLIPSITFLLVLPGLIALGLWQLDRAQQKMALQQEYDQRSNHAPIRLGSKMVVREDLKFYKVQATGTYDFEHQFLVDNRVLDRKVGYYVVTPLRIKNSNTLVLINRGWVLGNPDRTILPETPMPKGQITVRGTAIVPLDKVFQLAKEKRIEKEWPSIWQHINIKRFKKAVEYPVQPIVVLLDPEKESSGLLQKWKRLDTGIAVHQGYAFQWFSLALALAAIYFLVNFRIQKDDDGIE